ALCFTCVPLCPWFTLFPTRRSSDLVCARTGPSSYCAVTTCTDASDRLLLREHSLVDPVSIHTLTSVSRKQSRMGVDHLPVVRSQDRKSTRLNSSHVKISYAVFCLKK